MRKNYTLKSNYGSWTKLAEAIYTGYNGWDATQAQRMAISLMKSNPGINRFSRGMTIRLPAPPKQGLQRITHQEAMTWRNETPEEYWTAYKQGAQGGAGWGLAPGEQSMETVQQPVTGPAGAPRIAANYPNVPMMPNAYERDRGVSRRQPIRLAENDFYYYFYPEEAPEWQSRAGQITRGVAPTYGEAAPYNPHLRGSERGFARTPVLPTAPTEPPAGSWDGGWDAHQREAQRQATTPATTWEDRQRAMQRNSALGPAIRSYRGPYDFSGANRYVAERRAAEARGYEPPAGSWEARQREAQRAAMPGVQRAYARIPPGADATPEQWQAWLNEVNRFKSGEAKGYYTGVVYGDRDYTWLRPWMKANGLNNIDEATADMLWLLGIIEPDNKKAAKTPASLYGGGGGGYDGGLQPPPRGRAKTPSGTGRAYSGQQNYRQAPNIGRGYTPTVYGSRPGGVQQGFWRHTPTTWRI